MKIVVLNGSMSVGGNAAALAEAFEAGASQAGHEVKVIKLKGLGIEGCRACEYCHTKGEGQCIIKDDMAQIAPDLNEADMVVFCSPVHYFGFTGLMQSVITRFYAAGKPAKATKYALLLSSMSPGVYAGIEAQYELMLNYFQAENVGVFEYYGPANKSDEALEEVRNFAASL
ncbi:MAG: flavodoxin family protein [Eggerthellaceae bacterium]|nr:flavodoxin family protein [Eggerthellaceae bacterium]